MFQNQLKISQQPDSDFCKNLFVLGIGTSSQSVCFCGVTEPAKIPRVSIFDTNKELVFERYINISKLATGNQLDVLQIPHTSNKFYVVQIADEEQVTPIAEIDFNDGNEIGSMTFFCDNNEKVTYQKGREKIRYAGHGEYDI